jgi:hypothetical protein
LSFIGVIPSFACRQYSTLVPGNVEKFSKNSMRN